MDASSAMVGFIGLGAMGRGMAATLVKKGFRLRVFDIRPEASDDLVKLGAVAAPSPSECAKGCDVVVLAVLSAQQVTSVLFDGPSSVFASDFKGVCVCCATVSPAFAEETSKRVQENGASMVDCPMSGGTIRAASGDLTFMASADPAVLARARPVIDGMGSVFVLGDKPGLGSGMKMVNQILAGSHIVLAAEAMAMAAKLGLNTRQVYDVISSAAGNSFMFGNRVPHMLDNDDTPHSAIDIWPKDLGIVMDEARRLGFSVPMTGQALQLYFAARGLGLGSKDDSMVVRVYEKLTDVKVACTAGRTKP